MKLVVACLSLIALGVFALALPATDSIAPSLADAATRPDAALSQSPAQLRLAQAGRGTPARSSKVEAGADAAGENKAASRNANAKTRRDTPVTAKMEADVRDFVREHHRELLDVLTHLKGNLPAEYARAVRELSRHRLRLQQLEGRERYAVELKLWKAQSRAQLLAAKVQMGDDKAHREALRDKLVEIYDLRAAALRRDRDRVADRLRRLEEQLRQLQQNRDENLERQLQALTRKKTSRQSVSGKSGKRSGGNANAASPTKRPAKKTSTNTNTID